MSVSVTQFDYADSLHVVDLSATSDGPPFIVHGVALGNGDVTYGKSQTKKKWPADELRKAAESLRGSNLVVDHENNVNGVVGQVTKAGYKEDTGVIYQAELYDEELAEKIENGLLEVSIRGYHKDEDELEEDPDTGALIVENITFDNLSIVPQGAAPSNSIDMGSHDELSSAELRAATEELEDVGVGDWVKTDDGTHGIVISPIEGGDAEIDVYEESDDEWRAIGETMTVAADTLSMWDIDEDSIGTMEKDESTEEMADPYTQGDWVEWDTRNSTEKGKVVGSYEAGDDLPDFRGSHSFDLDDGEILYALRLYKERDGSWHPIEGNPIGHYHDSVRSTDEPANVSEEPVELSPSETEGIVAEGDWAQWYPETGPEEAHGKVLRVDTSGEEATVVVRMYDQDDDGVWHPTDHTKRLPMDSVEGWGNYPSDDAISEERLAQTPSWDEGQLVRWQAAPSLFGEIVHVDEDRHVVMVDIHEQCDRGLCSTGFTITAGYSDLQEVESVEEMASEVRDTPVEDQDADYDPDEEFSEQVEETLRNKVEEHNEKYGDESGKEVTYRMLKNVFKRGIGAYNDSHRPGMTPQQWAYARVNAFLYLVRNGNPENDQYTQDNDLLPEDHPKYSGDAEENALTTRESIVSDVFGKHDPMGSNEEKTPREIVEQVSHAELESSMDELDEVYSEWSDAVNMSAEDLREWSENPCSREASLDPEAVLERNLRLLERDKDEWTEEDISDAKRTISFIARMRGMRDRMTGSPKDEDNGCPTDWAISLLNWAYNPFDEIPDAPENSDLESVEAVSLSFAEDIMATNLQTAELAEYSFHEVDFDGQTEEDWSAPDMEDFLEEMDMDPESVDQFADLSEDERSTIADHFLISECGFPPENYGCLKLPVVEPSGELNVNALAAVKGGRGVSAVDGLSSDMESSIVEYVNSLASEYFDRDWSEMESASTATVKSVELGASHNQITTMTDDIQSQISGMDEPVAVEAEELERLKSKAEGIDEMNETLEELRDRTAVLDEVDQSKVEELRDTENPVVLPSSEYEQLSAEAEQVKETYAEALAEEYPLFSADDLTDRFSIDELREKFEDEIGSVEEELSASSEAASPRSQDPSEEELSGGQGSEEELSDAVKEKQEEIREKIFS